MEMQSANLDDLIPENEREIISALERGSVNKCPYLKKEGKFFYYCGANIEEVLKKCQDVQGQIRLRKYRNIDNLIEYCADYFESCSLYNMEQEVAQ